MCDEQLLQQFRDKEPKALHEIYQKWFTLLLITAAEETADRLLIEDIIAEVLLKVFHHLPARVHTLELLKGYLCIAVRHAARNHHKKQLTARKHHGQLSYMISAQVEEEADDLAAYEYIEYYHRQICLYIDSFPLQLKQIIQYRLYEEKLPEEIAARLNIALQTVYNQLAKGRGLIRKKFPAYPALPALLTDNTTSIK